MFKKDIIAVRNHEPLVTPKTFTTKLVMLCDSMELDIIELVKTDNGYDIKVGVRNGKKV